MLPVSGALQLNTSEAHTLRPICSLKKAYSRLLRRLQGRQARFRGANLRSLAAACCGNSTHVRKDRAALSTWCHCVIGTHEASDSQGAAPRICYIKANFKDGSRQVGVQPLPQEAATALCHLPIRRWRSDSGTMSQR